MILVTGSSGLIGRHLTAYLRLSGIQVRPFDVQRSAFEDIRNRQALEDAIEGVEGVVHLAAVSRIQWAQRQPDLCDGVNVGALETLLKLCLATKHRPWIIFASSREVYGQATLLPVKEGAAFRPRNVYAQSKVEGERLIAEAANAGLQTSICRFSNVYGCIGDHSDRVVMAFTHAALAGGDMRVEGPQSVFDFTAIGDVVDGLSRLIELVRSGEHPPPIHFVSGVPTSLIELAELVANRVSNPTSIVLAPPRFMGVSRFIGDPDNTARLLGWRASTPIGIGIARLLETMRADKVS